MPPAPRTSLARAMLIGLMVGLFVGGLGLLGTGVWALSFGPDCTGRGLTAEECALEEGIAMVLGRQQMIFGAALALMGIALFLLFRSRAARGEGTQPGSEA